MSNIAKFEYMKTAIFKPLERIKVDLIQLHRGQISAFLKDLCAGKYTSHTFEISQDDAKALFREMKAYRKYDRAACNYSHSGTSWFFQVQAYADPLLVRNRETGRYFLTISTYRKE